jgi:hypothetical protein
MRRTIWFQIIVGVSVACKSKAGNNKIKLLTEYENVIQEGLLLEKWNDLNYTFIFRKPFYFITSDFKIIDHENPDNNLESPRIMWYSTPYATKFRYSYLRTAVTKD